MYIQPMNNLREQTLMYIFVYSIQKMKVQTSINWHMQIGCHNHMKFLYEIYSKWVLMKDLVFERKTLDLLQKLRLVSIQSRAFTSCSEMIYSRRKFIVTRMEICMQIYSIEERGDLKNCFLLHHVIMMWFNDGL